MLMTGVLCTVCGAQVYFPNLLQGRELDTLARRPLWDAGLIYRHGTGHGIGMYLSVHEGKTLDNDLHNRVFIRPSSDGTYYGMVMVCSVRPGLRPLVFHTFLLHALTY